MISNELMNVACSECKGRLRRKTISQEFEGEGLKVRIAGIKGWVCSRCGEIYFEPGAAQRLTEAVNSLFNLARAVDQHKGRVNARVS
jgi:YgiT-type zinc finger domain-containing protein